MSTALELGPGRTDEAPSALLRDSRHVLGHPRPARTRLLIALNIAATIWYFSWLLQPQRVGSPGLYAVLVLAEMANLVQAFGFWWTLAHDRERPHRPAAWPMVPVDVMIPRYNEPASVVEPVVAAAVRMRGADVRVHLLDDGDDPAMAEIAARHGARHVTRSEHAHAKAGNVNHALAQTDAPYVAVFDCDHVPHEDFLVRTTGHLEVARTAFVQTPQFYANHDRHPVAAAAWGQQALFFGSISRGKDAMGTMFCCGTNVIFRREALEDVGGFPVNSLTEDFELSLVLHERGWRSAYVNEVLAHGLGPEDMSSYVSQQMRWARGCLSALPRVIRARLPLRQRLQYLLSAAYFLSGWSILVYMVLPIVRILTGAQPVAAATADAFLIHFAPYFVLSLLAVAVGGAGTYTFRSYSLAVASFWVHISATWRVLRRRPGRFVVTPKTGSSDRQPWSVWPGLTMSAVLIGVATIGLWKDRSAGMLNNVAFALVHVSVLASGMGGALLSGRAIAATWVHRDDEARWASRKTTPPAG